MAQVSLNDLSLKGYYLTTRSSYLKDVYFNAYPQIDVERPNLLTKYFLKNSLFNKKRISVLESARAYRYVLENRVPVILHHQYYEKGMVSRKIDDQSLFAGSTTSKFKGVPLYPEFLALTLWPELWSIPERKSNPFHITEQEVNELNYEIFPHWINYSIMELTRSRIYGESFKKTGMEKSAPLMRLHDQLVFFMATKFECISHTIPDFKSAIKVGLRTVINEAKGKEDLADNQDKKEFYQAIGEVLEGIIKYSKNLADEAERLAQKEKDPAKKEELLDIAKINCHVPENPARNFREGLTTVWICWIACHLENVNAGLSLGRLDQILYDLYKKDIEEGVLDINEAIELICCLWLKIGDHVPSIPEAGEQLFGGTGSNQAITLGGVDQNGDDAVNDLTYVMLRATELMRLRDPNLNCRYYAGKNSRDYLKRICEVNINTGATPAMHNDRAIIDALVERGDTLEQARDYGIVGCVEPCSSGRAYSSTGASLVNLASALELTLFNGRHRHTGEELISMETGDPANFNSFEEFQAAFEKQARWLMKQATDLNNIAGKVHQNYHQTPILSALFEGPMEKGKDLIEGGATINSSAIAIIALADVADSLSALEKVVFEEKEVSFSGMIDAIRKNFEGYDALHARLVNPEKTPKWGNEDAAADANVSWVLKMVNSAMANTMNYRGGPYRVGYWTMTMHAGFGRLTMAIPSGRKARENFSSGFTPESGLTPSLTKTLNSVASLPSDCLNGGVAFNLKYTPEKGDAMLDNFLASVAGYFESDGNGKKGGVEIQFNVTTHDTFVDAVKNPDKHPELLVRVSGYTAYFKDLNPQMQKEIIDRTEYLLSKGGAVDYEPFPLPVEE